MFVSINNYTGLEFNDEFVFVDDILFNQSLDKRLVIFGDDDGSPLLKLRCPEVQILPPQPQLNPKNRFRRRLCEFPLCPKNVQKIKNLQVDAYLMFK